MSASLPHGLFRSAPATAERMPQTRSGLHALAGKTYSLPVWWHFLSLDAPTVAVVWCLFFGAVFRLHFPWIALPTLALGTWCVYVADRLLDGWRASDATALRDRHWFYLRHRKVFSFAWSTAAILLAYLIFFRVPAPVRVADILLCLIGLLYFFLIHVGFPGKRGTHLLGRRFPKELAVGFLFAIAAAAPAWARLAHQLVASVLDLAILAAAVFAFGAVCWLNCVAIQTWEDLEASTEIVRTILCAAPPEGATEPRGLTQFLGEHLTAFATVVGALGLVLTLATLGDTLYPLFASIALSAALFLALIRHANRFSALSLRIAADAALLTPLLFLLRVR